MLQRLIVVTLLLLLSANSFGEDIHKRMREGRKLYPTQMSNQIAYLTQYYVSESDWKTDKLLRLIETNRKKFKRPQEAYYINEISLIELYQQKNLFKESLKIIGNLNKDEYFKKHFKDAYMTFLIKQGALYFELDDQKKSEKSYREAHKVATQLKDTAGMISSYCNIATMFMETNNDSAEYYLLKAKEFEKYGHTYFKKYIDGNLAVVYMETDRLDESEALIMEILKDSAAYAWGGNQVNLGTIEVKRKNYLKALEYFEEALYLSRKKGDYYVQGRAFNKLAEVHEVLGNYKEALQYKHQWDSINELNYGAEIKNAIDSVEISNFKFRQEMDAKIAQEKIARANEQKRTILIALIGALLSLAIVTFFFFVVRRKNIQMVRAGLANMDNDIARSYHEEGEDLGINEELLAKLENYLIQQQEYRRPNLTLDKLARKIGSNSKDLSQLINSYYQMTFRNLLNQLRINDAKRMLSSKKMNHYSIEGIAKTVGYANLSTFNRNFKEVTGVTPSFFQKQSFRILDTGKKEFQEEAQA